MRRGIVYVDENYAEFGMFADSPYNIRIIYEGSIVWGISYEALKDYLGFDYLQGHYVLGKDINTQYFHLEEMSFLITSTDILTTPSLRSICLRISKISIIL